MNERRFEILQPIGEKYDKKQDSVEESASIDHTQEEEDGKSNMYKAQVFSGEDLAKIRAVQAEVKYKNNDNADFYKAKVFSEGELAEIESAKAELGLEQAKEYDQSPEGEAQKLADELITETDNFLRLMDTSAQQMNMQRVIEFHNSPKQQLVENLRFMGESMPEGQDQIRSLREKLSTQEYAEKLAQVFVELKNQRKAA